MYLSFYLKLILPLVPDLSLMLFFLLFVVACEEVVAGDCVEGFVSFF